MRSFVRFALFLLLFTPFVSTSAYAFAVHGAIADKWNALGGAQGPLGAPTSDEADAPGGGRFNAFQNGFIYWKKEHGAFAVYGSIGVKWNAAGRVQGYGYPLTDELPASNGGRYNNFELDRSIYYHPAAGTHLVYGSIRAKWLQMGGDKGALGFPVSDEHAATNLDRVSEFQSGVIYWSPKLGPYAVYGEIGKRWLSLGAERGVCGAPTGDEADFDDGRDGTVYGYGIGSRFRRSTFTNGQILWSKSQHKIWVECGSRPPVVPVVPVVPQGEACNFTAVAKNLTCLNADGTPSTILTQGGTSGSACGSDAQRAKDRAKAVLAQAVCLSEGSSPQPGCCTYTLDSAAGCGCK